jgi:hypothetical protein
LQPAFFIGSLLLAALHAASIEVAVPQPRHVRAFALFGLKLARQARCR